MPRTSRTVRLPARRPLVPGTTTPDAGLPKRPPRPTRAERARPEVEPVESPAVAIRWSVQRGDRGRGRREDRRGDRRHRGRGVRRPHATARDDDTAAAETAQGAADDTAHDIADDTADDTADAGSDIGADAVPVGRSASPRPRPTPGPGPNGTYRDLAVPSTPYEAFDDGPGQNGTAIGPGQNGTTQYGIDRDDDLTPTGTFPHTTPLPVVPGSAPATYGLDDGADALFAASVPAIAEPDGLPRSRRPLAELRVPPT